MRSIRLRFGMPPKKKGTRPAEPEDIHDGKPGRHHVNADSSVAQRGPSVRKLEVPARKTSGKLEIRLAEGVKPYARSLHIQSDSA